jgi:hypothetical protein
VTLLISLNDDYEQCLSDNLLTIVLIYWDYVLCGGWVLIQIWTSIQTEWEGLD